MSPGREWRTTDEIRSLIHEETKGDFGALQKKLEEIREIAADGTQASLNTAVLLVGNSRYGIKGSLPDIQERLLASENRDDAREKRENDRDVLWEKRHDDHTTRLEILELGQHRTRRFISACVRAAFSKAGDEDKREFSPVRTIATGIVGLCSGYWLPLAGKKILALLHFGGR